MNAWAIGVRVTGARVTGEFDSFGGGVPSFEAKPFSVATRGKKPHIFCCSTQSAEPNRLSDFLSGICKELLHRFCMPVSFHCCRVVLRFVCFNQS